jgi:signal transduction histidine kinase
MIARPAGRRAGMIRWSPAVAVLATLVTIAAAIGLGGASPGSLVRHLFFIPIALAALLHGLKGGLAAAAGAVLLFAPVVLPHVERHGVSSAVHEAFVSMTLWLIAGGVVGALRTHARRGAQRLALLVAVQRTLARDDDLDVLLRRLRALLIARLQLADAALVLRDGESASDHAAPPHPDSPAVRVALTGEPAFVADTGRKARPSRSGIVPLMGAGGPIGALAVEAEEIAASDRADLLTLGAYIGLGLENARLAARLRRSAEELDAKVAAATRHLEQMDRAKSTFVAIASHELRTPLTALLGFTELLSTRTFAPGEVRRLGTIVHRETQRLARLVDDLLDLSRLERGSPPELRRRALSPARALLNVSELFGDASARLQVECGTALPDVDADPDAVDRVLKNLVSNALKYSPPAAPVRLCAETDGSEQVRFVVEDRGPGIAAAALPHVFEPYYRAPGASGTAPGTGLGLAVVKALVEAHGGSIEASSEPGRGTRIAFTLPRAGTPPAEARASA